MKYSFKIFTFLLLILTVGSINAQEFDLSVKVSAPNLKTAETL